MTWTDDRIDDLANRMDAGFARGERQIKELRQELKGDLSGLRGEAKDNVAEQRTEIKTDIAVLRAEMKNDFAGLHGEIRDLRSLIVRFAIALVIGLVGIVATLAGAIATGHLTA